MMHAHCEYGVVPVPEPIGLGNFGTTQDERRLYGPPPPVVQGCAERAVPEFVTRKTLRLSINRTRRASVPVMAGESRHAPRRRFLAALRAPRYVGSMTKVSQ